jgi:hypothetical protein
MAGRAHQSSPLPPTTGGIAEFPVKFPDSREIAWRRARSALRRQPGFREAGGATPQRVDKPAVGGLLQFDAGL